MRRIKTLIGNALMSLSDAVHRWNHRNWLGSVIHDKTRCQQCGRMLGDPPGQIVRDWMKK